MARPAALACAQIVVFAEELIIQPAIAADHNQAHGGNLILANQPVAETFFFAIMNWFFIVID